MISYDPYLSGETLFCGVAQMLGPVGKLAGDWGWQYRAWKQSKLERKGRSLVWQLEWGTNGDEVQKGQEYTSRA